MIAACNKLGFKRDHCLAHVFHLIVMDCLKNFPEVKKEIDQYKEICKSLYFANEIFKQTKKLQHQEKAAEILLSMADLCKYGFINTVGLKRVSKESEVFFL